MVLNIDYRSEANVTKQSLGIVNEQSPYPTWLRRSPLVEEEDAGYLVDGWALPLPLGNGACDGILALAGEVGSDAEAGLRTTGADDIVEHLEVAVGGLDEELGLMLGIGTRLEMFEHLGTLATIDGQVAMEGKALAIEP